MAKEDMYVGIAVFESVNSDRSDVTYSENFYMVRASDLEQGKRKIQELAASEALGEYTNAENEVRTNRLLKVVDVNQCLRDPRAEDCAIYSRHFDSIEAYSKFDPLWES